MMTSFLLAVLMAMHAQGAPAPPSSAVGYLSDGEYTNPLLGFSMRLPGKWELREIKAGDSAPSGSKQANPTLQRKPDTVHLELQSEKIGMIFISAFRRDLSIDFRQQVEAVFDLIRTRLILKGPDPVVTEKWKDRQLVVQDHAGIQGETENLLGFESGGYIVVITTVAYKNQGNRLEQPKRTLSFSSESPDFSPDLLLRARHSEASGFSLGSTEKEVTLLKNGTLQYACRYSSYVDSSGKECGHASPKLSEADLAAMKNLLASAPVASLDDEYPNDTMGLDYSGTMSILIARERGGQWILLRNLGFSGEKNNKLYPSAVRSLVCKIFGLRRLAGDAYGGATSYGTGPTDKPRDDTWCDESSLRL